MATWYDIKLMNGDVLLEDIQGPLADELYAFLQDEVESPVKASGSYLVKAKAFAEYLAKRHTPVINKEKNTIGFQKGDSFYYEDFRHFKPCSQMSVDEQKRAFLNGDILLCHPITEEDRLEISMW